MDRKHCLISAIVLAGGQSTRMGKMKQLLPLGQGTVLQRTIGNFLSSRAGEVIVVVGYESERVVDSIRDQPVKVALNPDYREGMSTSIVAALHIIDKNACGFMIALGDQPLIDSRTINHLLSKYADSEKGIIIPVYEGKRGHPVIFDIKYKKELAALTGDVGAASVIARHSEDVLEVNVSCEGVLTDIDTPEDYEALNTG